MDLDPLAQITEGCWLALRLGLRISSVPTGNLRIVDGVYMLGAGKHVSPAGSDPRWDVAASGDWRQDVATTLGVDAQWITGFLDGFAQEPESSTDGEYIQGYLSAEEVRTTRYRKELPDRR